MAQVESLLVVCFDIGAAVEPLYCEPDGEFPNHHPDPTVAENVVDLAAAVRRLGADVGIG